MTAPLSRRAGLLSFGSLAFTARAAQAQLTTSTIADPSRRLQVYARVRGGVKGATALWGVSGLIYAKFDSEMALPLFRVIGASLNTIMTRPDGGLTQTMDEAGYFADLTTGAIMARWRNPVSGAETTPEPYKMRSTQDIGADGTVEKPNVPFPISVSGGIGAVDISGDTLWIAENFSARVGLLSPVREGRPPEIVPGKVRVIDSLATFQARIADVVAGEDTFVPATLAFTETDPWFGWMGMGERPGLQLWQLRGRKLRNAGELPTELRARLGADYPGFL